MDQGEDIPGENRNAAEELVHENGSAAEESVEDPRSKPINLRVVLANLHTIGSIHVGDKIRSSKGGVLLQIDRQGPLQGVSRWLQGGAQHRNSNIQIMKGNIELALLAIEDPRYKRKERQLEKAVHCALRGLSRIQITYERDEVVSKQLSDLIATMSEALEVRSAPKGDEDDEWNRRMADEITIPFVEKEDEKHVHAVEPYVSDNAHDSLGAASAQYENKSLGAR